MDKSRQAKRQDRIAEEAGEWFVQMQDADVETKSSFVAWLKASPEHVREYLEAAAIWAELPALKSQPSAAQLAAAANAHSDPNVVAIFEEALAETELATPNNPRTWRWWSMAAGVAAIIIATAVFLPPAEDPNVLQTAIGEQTSFSLDDGSVVTLNTQSQVRLNYSEQYRDIVLLNGEALFDVAKDAERPFRVITDWAVIEAVGTQFNVLHTQESVTVTVVEGTIEVAVRGRPAIGSNNSTTPNASSGAAATVPIPVTVGQQAEINARSGEVAVIDMDVETAMAWQDRRLIFESLSLGEVIDQFNRYNDPPLLIGDPELSQLPISGVFKSNDRASFVQFLQQMNLAESQTRSDGTIVLYEYGDEKR